ncbi:unnamed protein product [Cuscuta epithymum]|nr:unnamed protein product [Cuscuta epithymum]
MKTRGSAIAYAYPCDGGQEGFAGESIGEVKDTKSEQMHPIVLVDSVESKIFAYVDEGPNKEPQNPETLYEYSSNFTLGDGSDDEQQQMEYAYDYSTCVSVDEGTHIGLGFHKKAEAVNGVGSSSKADEKEDTDSGSSCSDEENGGFLSIGGLRLYTHDISDKEEEEEEGEEVSSDEESSDSSENSSDDCSDEFESGSGIDDEIAADYLESTGGIDHIVNVDKLVDQIKDEDNRLNEALEKLGGIALQEASTKYGMEKHQPRRKSLAKSQYTPPRHVLSPVMDDLMFVKDPRTISGRKKHAAKFPHSWPFESQKSKNFRRIPGEKKKHRKEVIAMKRRERMIRRGVDLQKINEKLQQMVLNGADILSFEPMHTKDCSQVRRLASIYRLWSGCQGSGKKRFVTVAREHNTSMPSAHDRVRLEELIGANEEDDEFVVNDERFVRKDHKLWNKSSRGKCSTSREPRDSNSSQIKPLKSFLNSGGNNKDASSRKKRDGKIGPSYSSQPVSFISSGIMGSEKVEEKAIEESKESNISTPLENYGAFELHTTGFGSKMMVKMGFTGGGLGKDGQGIAEPIQVSQRPKALGLGAPIAETSTVKRVLDSRRTHTESVDYSKDIPGRSRNSGKRVPNGRKAQEESQGFAAFENHTKGFGSKMMAKMGFVEGMGLGRDSQGITTPIHAVRRPKSQGLGAKR